MGTSSEGVRFRPPAQGEWRFPYTGTGGAEQQIRVAFGRVPTLAQVKSSTSG